MEEQEIFDKVQNIVAHQLGVEIDQITQDANFVTELGADSLDTVELVMSIEEEFDIEILDEDAENIATLQQAVSLIKTKVNTVKA
uniref:acyl carrier protein n=1 Tax=Timspurckia oligopyrenoides TaxID=708627 RepID=UPI001FCE2651|nr:acyl carrier protein [Timspurckia oligopyrenoides]UNJ17510.1 acyl carrier protein [Timspurckia oligopyrenoides]